MLYAMTPPQALDSFYPRVAAFVRRRVPNAQDAADVTQTIFARVHERLPDLADDRKLPGWIFRIARNAIADHYRARRDRGLQVDPESVERPDRTARSAEPEVASWLAEFIQKLPAAYREALTLSDVEAVPLKEIARRIGLTESAAKSRVQRARAMVRRKILRCCDLFFDTRGGIVDYRKRTRCPESCDT